MQVSDAELVTRSRRRDSAAFGSLVERHQDLVFGVALARCGDPELASDVVQDAFVIAWRTLDRLRDSKRVGSWVAGIARNLASGATRARAREAKLPPEAAPGNVAVPTPEDAALAREGSELVQRALADLPETHREVLVLHYFQAQSVAAIADGLAISEDLVKQRLSRGRRAVRDHISRLLDDGRLRVRPRTGLAASVVAAITIPTREAVASTTAGKLFAMTSGTKKLALAAAAALALVGGGATWVATRPSTATAAIEATTPRETSAIGSQSPARSGPAVRRISPEARAELLAKIRDARSRRSNPAPASSAPPSSTGAPALASGQTMEEYVLEALQEIMPLLKECYAEGLERIPTLPAGNIVLDFKIEGEPGIGGVIGESTIAKESTITDAAVRECMQETVNAVEIDPPEHGVTYRMRTAIAMSPDGEPASDIDQSLKYGPGAPPAGGVVVTE